MIRRLMRKRVDRFEREWNYDASYMRDLIEASPRAAWLFARATALGKFRRDVPLEAWFAASITAVRQEDYGPCTQLGGLDGGARRRQSTGAAGGPCG